MGQAETFFSSCVSAGKRAGRRIKKISVRLPARKQAGRRIKKSSRTSAVQEASGPTNQEKQPYVCRPRSKRADKSGKAAVRLPSRKQAGRRIKKSISTSAVQEASGPTNQEKYLSVGQAESKRADESRKVPVRLPAKKQASPSSVA